jgi:hypothetical protein
MSSCRAKAKFHVTFWLQVDLKLLYSTSSFFVRTWPFFLLTKMKCASFFSAQATVRIDMIFKLSVTEVTVKVISILAFFTLSLNCVSEELQLVSIKQVMKTCGENWVAATDFLTLALGSVEWSASSHGRFTRGEMPSGTKRIGGWVGYENYLGVLGNKKLLLSLSDPKRGSSGP